MKLSERINKKFGTSEAIPGFKVMEWLRGVRDEHYRLYKSNPKEYFRRIGLDYEEVKKNRAARKREQGHRKAVSSHK